MCAEYSFSENKRMQPANLQQTAKQLFSYQLRNRLGLNNAESKTLHEKYLYSKNEHSKS